MEPCLRQFPHCQCYMLSGSSAVNHGNDAHQALFNHKAFVHCKEPAAIVCQSSNLDDKWKTMITELDIPDMNIINRFNETKLEALYDLVKEEYINSINGK